MPGKTRRPDKEPALLRRGKLFHRRMRRDWAAVGGVKFEQARQDLAGRSGRIDLLWNSVSGMVGVIEVKNTDWDKMQPDRVRPNALRHAAQVWKYVEPYLDREGIDVCPGLIYSRVPRCKNRLEEVEAVMHERFVQVVWQDDRRFVR